MRINPSTPNGSTPKPLTKAEAETLLQYFTPAELAALLAQSHSKPSERPHLHRDPITGLWLDPTAADPQFHTDPDLANPPNHPSPHAPEGQILIAGHRFEPVDQAFDNWAESRFYVPDRLDPATFTPTSDIGPIVLMDWQKVLLRFMLWTHRPLANWYHDLIISTLKKTGKSAIAAAIGRYIAEKYGNYSEVICLGSDKEQAEDKLYAAITKSIELSPAYDANLQTLFDLAVHPDDPDPEHPTLFMPDYSMPLWRLRSDGAQHIPNHGTVKAVPRVYKKLAGGNQTAAIFTEVWTWDGKEAQRLVDEMTPPPTRPRSIRLFEGYAGYEGESGIWENLWDMAMNPKLGARMVTREELIPFGGWPFPPAPGSFKDNDYEIHRNNPDPIPLYVNDSLSIVAFIDQGEVARRMPWQTPAYYESQKLDESYDRHHRNVKSAHKNEFISKSWWNACDIKNHPGYTRRKGPNGTSLQPVPESLRTIPPLLPSEPCVMSVDGSVVDDCTALMILSYATWWEYLDPEPNPAQWTPQYLKSHPEQERRRRRATNENHVMVREYTLWEPTKQHPMNYTTMVKPEILRYFGYHQNPDNPEGDDYVLDPDGHDYDVKEVVYDAFQLHDLMVNLRDDYGVWIKSFSQSTGRDTADKDLHTSIRDRTLWHDDDPKLDEHRAGAAKRVPKVQGSATENRIHIVKKSNAVKIDLFVVMSQGAFELKRLDG